ncbi:4-amino-4-deoxy-L-arabinose transferase [Mucilaginibacter mallensis]|uniref:4-amino-4-deoxy-L-arabinose transferase n=1 Tax=Mucilaginibacter mallensis TaxID=652787 RepID=A0A1H1RY53_MUCMA|nr:glycosyltransferase family 39 protein [Mucilaginibacter mallensis]SDS40548.1 4-amino-4-deoxy-L-arabinose transferase [Mucilaginibacter mallensis]
MKERNRQFYILLFVLAIVVNLAGISVKFFTDDPGLYASIAKSFIYKKELLGLFTYNQDWLDKPHFPFWVILCSFKIFGISAWAYRLPALFFFALSVVYTFLFTKKHYGFEVAAIAVLILMTALNSLMSNVDVRAEPYLMGLIIGSIYHLSRLEERFSIIDLLLTAMFTACAMMTKGVFVIVPIYGALFGQLLFQHKLKHLFNFKWIVLILLTAIFILPELYALYVQFDLHPEKLVFGRHNVSGIKWFFWDSQFGRFANSGPIKRQSGDIFFYVHTLLWAFAPWCLLFYYAIFKNLKEIVLKRKLAEYYALSGGVLLLLLFSISGFQLPFYTNSIFPLFAIITAPYCYMQLSKFGTKFRLIGQWLYIVLLPVAIIAINCFMRPVNQFYFVFDCLIFGILIYLIVIQIKEDYKRVFMLSCAVILFANFYLNTVFYEQLTVYKGQITAADYANQKNFDKYHLYSLRMENNIFQFYCKRPVDYVPLEQFSAFKPSDSSAFYVSQQSMDQLVQAHADFKVIKAFPNFPQENMSLKFINLATRQTTLDHVYLITK